MFKIFKDCLPDSFTELSKLSREGINSHRAFAPKQWSLLNGLGDLGFQHSFTTGTELSSQSPSNPTEEIRLEHQSLQLGKGHIPQDTKAG